MVIPGERASVCPRCGKRAVRKLARAGRTVRYRMFAQLSVPSDFLIPTCGSCGAKDLDEITVAELAKVMTEVYAYELRRRIREAIDKVCQFTSQRKLEKHLGLSQGYLSRLCCSKGTPSASLVAHLTLLAHEPHQRLRELEQDWDEHSPCDRPQRPHFCESCRQPCFGRGG